MPIELMVQKINGNLIPVTETDKQIISNIKQGQSFRVSLVRVSDRSARHHRLYFGGLVALVAEYWQTDSGLIPESDKKVIRGLIDYVASNGVDTQPIITLANYYLKDRAMRIKSRIPQVESAADTIQTIHNWLKEESGYCDIIATPTGISKRAKSIDFNAMPSEAEFMQFYKAAFSVAWKYVFANANFKDQQEAENLALRMADMG